MATCCTNAIADAAMSNPNSQRSPWTTRNRIPRERTQAGSNDFSVSGSDGANGISSTFHFDQPPRTNLIRRDTVTSLISPRAKVTITPKLTQKPPNRAFSGHTPRAFPGTGIPRPRQQWDSPVPKSGRPGGWAENSPSARIHTWGVAVGPQPGRSVRFSKVSVPPWDSAICRHRINPMPLPVGLVVKTGRTNWRNWRGPARRP